MGAQNSLTSTKNADPLATAKGLSITRPITGTPGEEGNADGKRITGATLLGMVNRAVDHSSKPKGIIAAEMGVKAPRLTALLSGERPWTLDRIVMLPDDVRVTFLRAWVEAEGLPASLANALRSLADAMDPQGRLPLIGETRRRD